MPRGVPNPLPEWECPKCHNKQRAIATEISHRCPHNLNKITRYERIDDEDSNRNS